VAKTRNIFVPKGCLRHEHLIAILANKNVERGFKFIGFIYQFTRRNVSEGGRRYFAYYANT
jgi:hypothetical protein